MKDDTWQFVGIGSALPWLFLLGFCTELHEAGHLATAALIATILSIVIGIFLFWAYKRK